MKFAVTVAAVVLLGLLAGVASACPYNQAAVVQTQAVVATPVVTQVVTPVVAQVVTPVVQSQVAVIPAFQTVVATPVVQTIVQKNVVVEQVQQRNVRQRGGFGGGGGLGGVIDAVGRLANTPVGAIAVDRLIKRR